MSESAYSNVKGIVWRDHLKGPGVATFEYLDGGHDHREMSQYEMRSLAERLGLTILQDHHDLQEWARL
jgi:hypothetical protein